MTQLKPVSQTVATRLLNSVGHLAICFATVLSAFAPATGVGQDGQDGAPNVLLICVDDLRPELNCFGASYVQSPNIDQLATRSRIFTRHYVQAPTCGASRFAMLTGRYGSAGNGSLFERARQLQSGAANVPVSMPGYFRQRGYTTVSVGKVSHHPGGRGGLDWNDESLEMPESWDRHLLPAGEWKHPRGWMHGLAHGEIRSKAQEMDVFQAVEGGDEIYPDGPSIDEALRQLETLANQEKPFFMAVGILRPHLPFGAPARYLAPYEEMTLPDIPHPHQPKGRSTWHRSGEFMKYHRWGKNPNSDQEFATQVRKHYAACVSYADAQVGKLLDQLAESGADQNTIVVLWGDHGWHLGEHAVWGKHTLFEESLRSPLLISYPNMVEPGVSSKAIVESIDLFPTLCELMELPVPESVHGASLVPILQSPELTGHPAISYTSSAKTIRTDRYRLIKHQKDGFVELYDHQSELGEVENIAAGNLEAVEKLTRLLNDTHSKSP